MHLSEGPGSPHSYYWKATWCRRPGNPRYGLGSERSSDGDAGLALELTGSRGFGAEPSPGSLGVSRSWSAGFFLGSLTQPEGWGAVTTAPASGSPRPSLERRNHLLVRSGLPDPVQPSSLVLMKPAQRKAALVPCPPAPLPGIVLF